jgi:hypothetical protein
MIYAGTVNKKKVANKYTMNYKKKLYKFYERIMFFIFLFCHFVPDLKNDIKFHIYYVSPFVPSSGNRRRVR